MRFRSIRLKDFKGFLDETIDLDRPLTVLIGPNGSGKSSVLEALSVLASHIISNYYSLGQTAQLMRFDAEAIDVRRSASSALIAASVRQGDAFNDLSYRILLDPSNGRVQDNSLPGIVDLSVANFLPNHKAHPSSSAIRQGAELNERGVPTASSSSPLIHRRSSAKSRPIRSSF